MTRQRCLSDIEVKEAVSLYNYGLDTKEIGVLFGCSQTTIRRWIRKHTPLKRGAFGSHNCNHKNGGNRDRNANSTIQRMISRGLIVPPKICSKCGKRQTLSNGKAGICAHHPDYNKPLEVEWLCASCHRYWHRNYVAIPKSKEAINGKSRGDTRDQECPED